MLIDYIGMERCDILYYLLNAGNKIGSSILAIDNSITGDLYHIYERQSMESAVVENLTVVRNKLVSQEIMEAYDYIFLYEGVDPQFIGPRGLTIFAPSCSEAEWHFIKDIEGADTADRILILRDVSSRKISAKNVEDEFRVEFDEELAHEINEKEHAAYIALTHNHAGRIPKGGEIFGITIRLLEKIFQVNKQDIKRLIK